MEWNSRERLVATAEGRHVDRPPCICPGGMMNMIFEEVMESSGCYWPEAHCSSEQMTKLAMELRKRGGFENYGVPFCMTVEAEALGADVEMGDRFTEPHVTAPVFKSVKEFEKFAAYDFSKGRIKVVLDTIAAIKEKDSECPVIGNLTGPFSLAGSLIEMSEVLKSLRRDPQSVHDMMTRISDLQAEFGRKMVEAGADFICISEPSGTGEIMGKKRFSEFSVKYINRVLDGICEAKKIVHICGDLSNVYDVLGDLHCHVFSFDAVVPVKEIKKYLNRKAVMGNVSTFAIVSGEEDTIYKLATKAMKHGADVLAPACGLSTQTSMNNVHAMIDSAVDFKPEA